MSSTQEINVSLSENILKKPRSSNFELYRIICMMLIVAHHYVVNSGLFGDAGLINSNPTSLNSIFLSLFGAWGKTGINCFVLITGYFMCTSQISLRKFFKLYAQILFYNIIIYVCFLYSGHEILSLSHLIPVLIPFWGFKDGFISCFLVFYLTIPFWNILIKNMTEKQHRLLILLILVAYTLLGSIPKFGVSFNYITWFGFIYLISAYIRRYPHHIFEKKRLWGLMSLALILVANCSIILMQKYFNAGYFFLSDCNKIFAVSIAICTFLWFKNINLEYSRLINTLGASTFGVLLIHANSDAMRTWLWKDVCDVVGHYNLSLGGLVLYSFITITIVFATCTLIEQLRLATIEKWVLCWYDNKLSVKADALIHRIHN